ncbi:MAG: chromate transporter [Actinomycetota bacterium]
MIYFDLFLSFLKIGLFAFGGGYGMIPLIEAELQVHGWLSTQEFVQVISISEMTPGPIAVNTATLVGYRTAGVLGGAVATLGVTLPSLILILATSHFLYKYRSHVLVKRILYGIKPVVLALIIVAIVFVAQNILFGGEAESIPAILRFIDPFAAAIMVVSAVCLIVFKVNPIFVLLASGAAGAALYYLGFI